MEDVRVFHTEPKAYRHEYKHGMTYADMLALRTRLRVVARPDPHTGPGGVYHIRSLYFDNVDDKALREKIDGINNREKFRIRYYNHDLSLIHLEKKVKSNGLCGKVATTVTREECERLLAGDYAWMLTKHDGLVAELYAKMRYQRLRPRVVVDYLREPYIYEPGGVRITFDSNIRSGLYDQRFLEGDLATMPASEEIILEVKYDAFLPSVIQDVIQLERTRTTAFSKYAACRQYG